MQPDAIEESGAEALRELWSAALRSEESDAALLAAWMKASIVEAEAPRPCHAVLAVGC